MSSYNKSNTICPKCGKEIEVKIWDSINADLNPEMKREILSGEFGKVICDNCNAVSYIQYPFLYHDMSGKYMIGVMSDYNCPMESEYPEGYILRTVDDLPQLVEKINIFDDGYDDVVMEVVKEVIRGITNKDSDDMLYSHTEKGNLVFALPNKEVGLSIKSKIYYVTESECDEQDSHKKEFIKVNREYILKE